MGRMFDVQHTQITRYFIETRKAPIRWILGCWPTKVRKQAKATRSISLQVKVVANKCVNSKLFHS